jgi:hypothetical protein
VPILERAEITQVQVEPVLASALTEQTHAKPMTRYLARYFVAIGDERPRQA